MIMLYMNYNKYEHIFIKNLDRNMMQEHRNNMIFQYNRICESGLIQKNQLNLRIDGIVNHTPLVNQYGLKEVGYTQHYKTRNDKEELLNVGNWFSDKLKTQSYDRPIDANITLS